MRQWVSALDDTDRAIVDLLRRNGRRSNVEVARELGISEGTVRKRIDRMVLRGTLRFAALTAPAVVGFPIHTLILLTVELAQVAEVARTLRDMREVMSVYCVTGEYDIVLEAVFESDEHLMSFLTERAAAIPGVVESKTCHIPQVVKHSYEWAIPSPRPARILIVDDDPDFVATTRIVLEREGYEVTSAANGSQALTMMIPMPPDMVIMDVMMEGVLDGWDASAKIRADKRLRDIPILVVSSITASDYLGMFPTDDDNLISNFLSKPAHPQQLLAEVRRLTRVR